MSKKCYQSLDEAIEHYLELRCRYNKQYENLMRANVSDYKSLLKNIYSELEIVGNLLIRNNIDLIKIQEIYEKQNPKR